MQQYITINVTIAVIVNIIMKVNVNVIVATTTFTVDRKFDSDHLCNDQNKICKIKTHSDKIIQLQKF